MRDLMTWYEITLTWYEKLLYGASLFCKIWIWDKGVLQSHHIPSIIYLFKLISRNTKKRCETFSKLAIWTPEYMVQFLLVPLLLTLTIFHTFFYCFQLLTLNKYICCNHVHNISSLVDGWANFPFTASETKCDW